MATAKDAYSLVSYYQKKYKETRGITPQVNRFKARWGFDAVLEDMSLEKAKGLIDYYFTTVSTNAYDLDWFFYNYDKLIIAKRDREQDDASLVDLRRKTKARVEEWRNRIGNQ